MISDIDDTNTPRCFKCGTNKGHIIKHHIKYEPEIIVSCCRSCHSRIHRRIRREGLCNLSLEETNKKSKLSASRRNRNNNLKRIYITENHLIEIYQYNIKTNNFSYSAYFGR